MAETLTGKLLVASPVLQDANFARSVVYLCAHSADGAFGLIVNRPIEDSPIGDHMPQWMEHVNRPAVFFRGGPVEPAAAFGLALSRTEPPDGGWLAVVDGVGLFDLSLDARQVAGGLESLRLFSGYSGWGAGQLEAEIGQDAWFVVDSQPADLFTSDPARLWRDVLRRQTGKLAMFAFFPENPSSN